MATADWLGVAAECTRGLSDDDGVALEARVVAADDDVDARVRLIGFYFLRPPPDSHRRRVEHLAWLAEHRPDIGLGGFGYVVEEQAPEGHQTIRRAWVAAAANPDANVDVLDNAASFLGFDRPDEAEPLLRRAAALEPANEKWRQQIAQMLTKRGTWADAPAERHRHACAAVGELETALGLASTDWIALGIRMDLADATLLAEDWERVRETAERVLVDNETCKRTFQYGNAIHRANAALGFAALAQDAVSLAAEYLVRAGKTPGSPQLNSFGPDLDLARELLARGERAAVVTYLADCARFWKRNEPLLTEWRATIERGEPTTLGLEENDDDTS